MIAAPVYSQVVCPVCPPCPAEVAAGASGQPGQTGQTTFVYKRTESEHFRPPRPGPHQWRWWACRCGPSVRWDQACCPCCLAVRPIIDELDGIPAWLAVDPLARRLMRAGWSMEAAEEAVERLAIQDEGRGR